MSSPFIKKNLNDLTNYAADSYFKSKPLDKDNAQIKNTKNNLPTDISETITQTPTTTENNLSLHYVHPEMKINNQISQIVETHLSELPYQAETIGEKRLASAAPDLATHASNLAILTAIHNCLQQLNMINLDAVKLFAATFHLECTKIRASTNGDKSAEKTYCRQIASHILRESHIHFHLILNQQTTDHLELNAKLSQLTNMVYLAQGLIALTGIEGRFGGRLGFHCLQHSLDVAVRTAEFYRHGTYEFAAFCAGANHDSVMIFQAPPPITDKQNANGSSARASFQQALHQAKEAEKGDCSSIMAKPEKCFLDRFTDENKAVIKNLKQNSEQARYSSWDEGASEKESYEQMEWQLQELLKEITPPLETHSSKAVNGAAAALLLEDVGKNIIAAHQFRKNAISGTIPLKSNFAPPNFGVKLATLANVSIIPGPAELAKLPEHLRARLITLLDLAITDAVARNQALVEYTAGKTDAATFKEAFEDMNDAKRFYALLDDSIKSLKESASTLTLDLDVIKQKIRDQLWHEKRHTHPHLQATHKCPKFELMSSMEPNKDFFLNMMPPFIDPCLSLSAIKQDEIIKALTMQLVNDLKNGPEVLDYLFNQLMHVGTGLSDLGALMQENAEVDWSREESIALIVEETPYQAQSFFSVNQILLQNQELQAKGFHGLHTQAIYTLLEDPIARQQLKISDEEYAGMLEFIYLTTYFLKEQIPFAEGRMKLVQHYIYAPMKAISAMLNQGGEEPGLMDFKTKYESDIALYINNFEAKYCIGINRDILRTTAIDDLKAFLSESTQSESHIAAAIIKGMAKRFGQNFIAMPHKYGYTDQSCVNADFQREQHDHSLPL